MSSYEQDGGAPVGARLLDRWQGQALLESELARRAGGAPSDLETLAAAVAAGWVDRVPAIERGPRGWTCLRCGGSAIRLLPCGRCGRTDCPFCEECATLGPARGCDRLYRFPARPATPWPAPGGGCPLGAPDSPSWPRLPFRLTPAQRRVADALARWATEPAGPGSMLLWAACGAGKTEMLLAAAAATLRAQGRVLVATPRREVVRELEPRIRSAFAPLPVSAWYGGAPEESRPDPGAPLVVATTHQCLRFHRAFHLVAVDEVDAFPFRDHEILRRAVERAALPGAKRLWVSATPPTWLRRQAGGRGGGRGRGRTGLLFLPVRPHGHALPEPRLLWDPRLLAWQVPGAWPRRLAVWLRASRARGARLLIFVPTVTLAQALPPVLARLVGEPVGTIWAGHPARDETLERFRRGRVGVLVSTSLLERGVTLPAVDVMVLFPEHPVFDAAALVQMAGRSGRSPEDPAGRVLFAGAWPSREVWRALLAVRGMNRRAAREGLLGSAAPGEAP
ncbi:helicase-related protein [Limnochorda pilosa]|uniref:Competence protein ComF n=1 Tax=Limnochorda pilosa TaxID=1555112 RepID=A0A0K2SNT8_LIMPI|nr:helicase-related protein [Limnochorda pilosa]BAS28803.1 competence protein ComF [Limnochorda pilosa]